MLREVTYNEIFTILIMVGLISITIAKAKFTHRFNDLAAILTTSKYFNIYSRDQKLIDLFDLLLLSNFIISTAVFTSICFKTFYSDLKIETNLMLNITLGIGAFLFVKILFERLIANIFSMDDVIEHYIFQKKTYKNYFGMLLIPINAFLIYSVTPSKTILYIVLSIFMVILIVRLSTTLKRYQKLIKSNLFYFILYLCTLEIAPYIILYKFITMY
ncbi:DUF4271 domain-containing protein [Formosa algae]|uniref:DUF4271 domain-containing protein n=1 Tax=Formosa algae TaxID=225843 RepID=A0A9X0YLW4_9FLAO|nr:DUF4271 domain-containing protein [Formosa algae]MBP1839303.1 hypothetical protein [Formosa algae]MDQ0334080.1 hypothetical protein [Formosa algae]OEI79406.1 DUF4271 domain-containing protein [Formosa algae]PNW29433.1 DUF4271 domain-containing protein [Formosa algae]